MKRALYDLKRRECLNTFDYYAWQTYVQAIGYEHITFDTSIYRLKKYPGGLPEAQERFNSILWPGPVLAGMGRSLGANAERVGTCQIQQIIGLGLGSKIPRLRSVLEPKQVEYTVTLRSMRNKPERNSDVGVWEEFARRIGAYLIDDYFNCRIPIEVRMALYAGARMNFGVMGGPMALLLWTTFPASIWCDPDCQPLLSSMRGHGMDVGGQWDFQLPHQRLVWQKPTLDSLMREFDAICRL